MEPEVDMKLISFHLVQLDESHNIVAFQAVTWKNSMYLDRRNVSPLMLGKTTRKKMNFTITLVIHMTINSYKRG